MSWLSHESRDRCRVPSGDRETFQDAELFLPPELLLGQFAALTVPQAELIALLERQNANLCKTRDLLVPRLLSGQLRLADIENDPGLVTASLAVHEQAVQA